MVTKNKISIISIVSLGDEKEVRKVRKIWREVSRLILRRPCLENLLTVSIRNLTTGRNSKVISEISEFSTEQEKV